MNKREEIEKRFDERFDVGNPRDGEFFFGIVSPEEIKSFFLDKILPEVLMEIVSINIFQNDGCSMEVGEQIKGYVKEKYNITL